MDDFLRYLQPQDEAIGGDGDPSRAEAASDAATRSSEEQRDTPGRQGWRVDGTACNDGIDRDSTRQGGDSPPGWAESKQSLLASLDGRAAHIAALVRLELAQSGAP